MEAVQEAKVWYRSAEVVHMADALDEEVEEDIAVGAGDAPGKEGRRWSFFDPEGSHSESRGCSYLAAGHNPESTVVDRNCP